MTWDRLFSCRNHEREAEVRPERRRGLGFSVLARSGMHVRLFGLQTGTFSNRECSRRCCFPLHDDKEVVDRPVGVGRLQAEIPAVGPVGVGRLQAETVAGTSVGGQGTPAKA